MIHPDTEVRFVNPTIGKGVFATAEIPMGTIVYVRDKLEIALSEEQFQALDGDHKAIANKYSYIEPDGTRIMSWDHANYMNHRCNCNIISTGYGFEIAIRDIREGEEVCDDYGLFNLTEEIPISCGCPECRGKLRPDDLEHYHEEWDHQIIEALSKATSVPQPLMKYMDGAEKDKLRAYLCGEEPYTSVMNLKCRRDYAAPPVDLNDSLPFTPSGFHE